MKIANIGFMACMGLALFSILCLCLAWIDNERDYKELQKSINSPVYPDTPNYYKRCNK